VVPRASNPKPGKGRAARQRALASSLGLAVLLGLIALIAAPVAAQSTPDAQTGGTAASVPASAGLAPQNPAGLSVGGTDPGPAPFIADPTAWAGTVFIGALSGLVRGANGDGVGLLEGLLRRARECHRPEPARALL
jgi:hypothetical protein